MADPQFEDCPAGVWTKIAENVLGGLVHKVSNKPNIYLQTYRDTGGVAPTLESDGVVLFDESDHSSISAVVPIDVYIWTKSQDGRVRVDL